MDLSNSDIFSIRSLFSLGLTKVFQVPNCEAQWLEELGAKSLRKPKAKDAKVWDGVREADDLTDFWKGSPHSNALFPLKLGAGAEVMCW